MCQPVTCRTCGKTTWTGCGMHVDDVRRAVPAAQWCGGHDGPAAPAGPAEPGRGGFLARLFGGR